MSLKAKTKKFATTMIITGLIIGLAISANSSLASPQKTQNAIPQDSPPTSNLPEGWQVYSNEGFGFEISYPPDFSLKTDFDSIGLNTGLGVAAGAPVWKFTLKDGDAYQGTSLKEASLIINVQNTPEALAQCSQFKAGSIYTSPKYEREALPTADVNSITFYKDIVEEGAMGNFYKKISYRVPRNEACYEITLFMHSLNIDFLPSGAISAFDEGEIAAKLESIFSTFQFLDLTPTFPRVTNPSAPQQRIAAQPLGGPNPEEDGIDVSHWQGSIDWSQVYGAGYTFAFTKATEGVGYTDDKFVYNTTHGTSAGVLMGAYHFARPDLANGGVAEAQYFVDQTDDYLTSGHLRPVLDLEVRGSLGKEELSTWVVAWMETVKAETGVKPLIYTNYSYVSNYLNEAVQQYELWIAYWTCDPTPSTHIPPTGPWRDWDFWQYYGPGYCGPNSVPGIAGNVDLNLFNGYLPGLHTFEINRPLAVSLTANPPSAHAPSNTQLITSVSGTATGAINYTFWWDCDVRGVDPADTAAACGDIPTPSPGTCAENQNGMKCTGIADPNYTVAHLYETSGNYTAKVITEREGTHLAEDRFLISIANPISSITPDPPSPAYATVNEVFQVNVDVEISTSQGGALQVSLIDGIPELKDRDCKQIPDNTSTTETFSLSFTESEVGVKNHLLWTRFRAGGNCPIENTSPLDQYQLYTIHWGLPEIDVQRPAGTSISDGGADNLGDGPVGAVSLTYTVDNTAGTNTLTVSDVTASNLTNASNFSLDTAAPLNIPPGAAGSFAASFNVDAPGLFSLDLALANNDGDENPYDVQVSGMGMAQIFLPLILVER